MKIIFATQNSGKVKEVKDILAGLDIEILSATEAGIFEEIKEDGKNFAENALKKAKFIAEKTGEWAMAEDSGLGIQELAGAPGVLTSRWAGEGALGEDLVKYTLSKMADIPLGRRQAYFQTAAALVSSRGEHWFFEGKIAGQIALAPKGKPRPKLPYDVIFIPEGESRTFAEMSEAEKNQISHRGRAFKKLKKFLESWLL